MFSAIQTRNMAGISLIPVAIVRPHVLASLACLSRARWLAGLAPMAPRSAPALPLCNLIQKLIERELNTKMNWMAIKYKNYMKICHVFTIPLDYYSLMLRYSEFKQPHATKAHSHVLEVLRYYFWYLYFVAISVSSFGHPITLKWSESIMQIRS